MKERAEKILAEHRDIHNRTARFFTTIGTLVGGRISLAATANSAAKSALTIAVRYAARLRQFGSSKASQETLVLDYPAHQRRLCPLIARVYAFDFALKYLVKQMEPLNDPKTRRLETLAAGLKAITTWNTTETIQTCREACGEGYLVTNRISGLKADTDICTTFEGDNVVLMQLAARNLLNEFKEKVSKMRAAQRGRFLLDERLAYLGWRNPFFAFNTHESHLCDSRFQMEMFRFRESATLVSAAREFRHLTFKRLLGPYAAFTEMQRQLLDLTRAYIERVVLEQF